MKTAPHPYTFTTPHLAALKRRFAALPAEPGEHPAPDAVEAACAALVAEGAHPTADRGHVATATYDRAAHRVSIVLHGNMLAFPVDIDAAPPAKPAKKGPAPQDDRMDVTFPVGGA